MSVSSKVRAPYEELSLALSNVDLMLSFMTMVIREHAADLPKGADGQLSFLVETAEKFSATAQGQMDALWLAVGGRACDAGLATGEDGS